MMDSGSDESRLVSAYRIDAICDSFEKQYQAGNRPTVTDFVERGQPDDRAALFCELLLVELDYRRRQGEQVRWADYVARFPEFSEQIEALEFRLGWDAEASESTVDAAEFRPAMGERIAQFEFVELLGTGAAGEVWKVRDTRLQRFAALKIPRSRDLSEAELHRFLREGRAAARLRHPHIISVHAAEREDGIIYIVSDFIEGENLRERLLRGKFTSRETALLCAKLAGALHYAHTQGIIHRDLKPANILVDWDGQPYIADFGLAKSIDDAWDLTVNGELLGTPAYMSPEQANGIVERVDHRSDVYSLGAVLYEMLSGQRPFPGAGPSVIFAIVYREPTPPRRVDAHIPRDLETICLKAMEKDPGRRYATAQELADDLRRYLDGEPIAASRPSRLYWLWRRARRRPMAVLAVAMTLAAICSLGIAAMYAERSSTLLDLRPVELATVPPGAQISFVPLADVTGSPLPERIHSAPGRSPIRAQLPPGDYLVVAVLDDGRFHEVLRHVPRSGETLSGVFRHNRWTLGDGSTVLLPSIEIPDASVTRGMARIEGGSFRASPAGNEADAGRRPIAVPSFYLDATEFTVGDCVQANVEPAVADTRWQQVDTDAAATASFDEAVAFAESVGKRLLTEMEFEFAATARGMTRYPWGERWPSEVQPTPVTRFGRVGSCAFDELASAPVVTGLCSNVAEWTTSLPYPTSGDPSGYSVDRSLAEDYRVAKGGDRQVVAGSNLVTAASRDPRLRVGVSRFEVKPGLGFRCARSLVPRLAPGDFTSAGP